MVCKTNSQSLHALHAVLQKKLCATCCACSANKAADNPICTAVSCFYDALHARTALILSNDPEWLLTIAKGPGLAKNEDFTPVP